MRRTLVIAAAAAALAATGAPAAQAGTKPIDQPLLAGQPHVEVVRALLPTTGFEAGRLLLWVRVNEPGLSRRGDGFLRLETITSAGVALKVRAANGKGQSAFG